MGRENQLVGAFGERAVETELLRREWLTSNVNASIRNAADYDMFAKKGSQTVHLRVKACGEKYNEFQFGGFRPGQDISFKDIDDSDFTILVKMGSNRADDIFYVVPTKLLRKQISESRRAYLAQSRRDGKPRKDTGHWTLHLGDLRSGEDRPSHGFRRKWARYSDNWKSLEK